MTYVTMIEDPDGNLVDIIGWCSTWCAQESGADFADWPCYESSSNLYCHRCGDLVRFGTDEYDGPYETPSQDQPRPGG